MSVRVGKAWYIYGLQNLASGSHKDSWDLGEGVPYFSSGGECWTRGWPGSLMLSRHTAAPAFSSITVLICAMHSCDTVLAEWEVA